MTPLLELPAVRRRLQPLTVETYHRLGELGLLREDVELLRGFVVTKMPKSPLHEFVSQMLMKRLFDLLPPAFELRREAPLSIGTSEPEPDFSVVRGVPADWLQAHPTTAALVIEVAVTSAELDEGKASIYAEAAVPESWIVRPDRRVVVAYREPTPDGYRTRDELSEEATLRCAALPDLALAVASILPPRQ
jgi:Uma2 family endonuclease